MMRGALIGVTVSAVLVLSLMLLLWMNDRRQEMGILVSLGVGKPSLVAQYLTEMVLIGLPSLVLGWLCAQGMAQWLGTTALHSVNASAAKELSSMGQVGGLNPACRCAPWIRSRCRSMGPPCCTWRSACWR